MIKAQIIVSYYETAFVQKKKVFLMNADFMFLEK